MIVIRIFLKNGKNRVFLKKIAKKSLLLIGVASSILIGSQKNDKFLTVRRKDGVIAQYIGKETVMGSETLVYPIILFQKGENPEIIPCSAAVRQMYWNDVGSLNVTWHDGTSGVVEIKK